MMMVLRLHLVVLDLIKEKIWQTMFFDMVIEAVGAQRLLVK